MADFTPEQLAAYIQEISQPGYDPMQAMIERGKAPIDPSGWDQSLADYYAQMEAYRQKLSDMGITYQDPGLNPYYDANQAAAGVSLPNFGQIFASANPQDYYAKLMQASADPTAAFQPFADFATKEEGFGRVTYDPNKQYRMVDGDGRVVYSGTGLEALQKMSQLVPSLSPKASSTWNIDSADIGADNWQPAGAKKVNSDTPGFMKVIGALASIAPMFIPGFGQLGLLAKMGAMGASGAIGAGAAGRDPLVGGLLGGLTAGALNVPLPGMQQGISGAVGSALGGAGQGALNAAGEIVVNAPSLLAQAVGNVVPGLTTGGVNAAAQSALDASAKTPAGQQAAQTPTSGLSQGSLAGLDPDHIINITGVPSGLVRNVLPSFVSGLSSFPLSGTNYMDQIAPDAANLEQDFDASFNQILVEARRGVSITELIAKYGREAVAAAGLVGGALAATGGAATAVPAATTPTTTPPGGLDEIVVTAAKPVPPVTGPLSFGVDAATQAAIAAAAAGAPAAAATAGKPALSTIDKIRLGLAGAGLIGNAVEGTPGGKVPAGFGSSSQFNNPLPAANLLDSTARTAADMGMTSPQDWYRYGYGPEQSFMTGVPQGAKNTSTAFTGYKKGGSVSEALSYDNLSPEEKNFVDYHRRNLVVMPYEHDGGTTTIYGMQDDVPGGVMLHPGYIHGQMVDPQSRAARAGALDWAMRSGIDFPVYPDQATADTRETAIHRDIIEPDLQRYESGDRGWLQGYARGGLSVQGAGDGRSDSIDARLSDGEYVMDAETVALLGNGSNKAGAGKLDRLRVNIRKHKGRKLAKGALSADAKAPERYLAGGLI